MTDRHAHRAVQRLWHLGAAALAVSLLGSPAAHAGGMAADLERQVQQNADSGKKVRVIVQLSGTYAATGSCWLKSGLYKLTTIGGANFAWG